MKQIKILSLVLALVMLFTFAACAKEEAQKTQTAENAVSETIAAVETKDDEAKISTVLVVTEEKTQITEIDLAQLKDGATMLDAFKADAYKDIFEADVTEGEYVMLNALKGLAPDAANNEYIAIFTTDKEVSDTEGQYTAPVEVDGVTYYAANFGVADLTLKAGESYLFQIATF